MLLSGKTSKDGSGLILLEKHANSSGLYDLGAEPGRLPGRLKITDSKVRDRIEKIWDVAQGWKVLSENTDARELFTSGKIKGFLIIGEDPLENRSNAIYFHSADFVAVIDLFETNTTRFADVVIPASTHYESGGTFTNTERRVLSFNPSGNIQVEMSTFETISALARLLGKPFNFKTPQEAFSEIKIINSQYSDIVLGDKLQNNLIKTPGKECHKNVIFRPFTVETVTYTAEEFSYNSIESYFNDRIKKQLSKVNTEKHRAYKINNNKSSVNSVSSVVN